MAYICTYAGTVRGDCWARMTSKQPSLLPIALVALGLAIAASACGGSKGKAGDVDLVVTTHSPADARTDLAEPIQIQFDKPVAAEDQIGVARVPGHLVRSGRTTSDSTVASPPTTTTLFS